MYGIHILTKTIINTQINNYKLCKRSIFNYTYKMNEKSEVSINGKETVFFFFNIKKCQICISNALNISHE